MGASDITRDVRRFFESYRSAFERLDAAAIAEHYAYPAHVTSDAGMVALVPVTSKEDWTAKLQELISMYRQISFASANVLDLLVTEL
jgi:ketosteroid isomerase-like protein